jgi:hypothetical protein
MFNHPDSFSLAEYLRRTVPELVQPLEDVKWSLWEAGDDDINGLETIYGGFYILALQIANVDGDISEDEVALIRDVEQLFQSDEDDAAGDLSNRQIRDIFQRSVRENSSLFE